MVRVTVLVGPSAYFSQAIDSPSMQGSRSVREIPVNLKYGVASNVLYARHNPVGHCLQQAQGCLVLVSGQDQATPVASRFR